MKSGMGEACGGQRVAIGGGGGLANKIQRERGRRNGPWLGWSVGGGVPGRRRVEEMAMERVACGKAIPHVFAQKKLS
jgi:hypothetical protein